MTTQTGAERLYNFMQAEWISRGQAYEMGSQWGCLGSLVRLDVDNFTNENN